MEGREEKLMNDATRSSRRDLRFQVDEGEGDGSVGLSADLTSILSCGVGMTGNGN